MAEQRPETLDHVRSQKKPVTKKCWIPLDSDVAEAHEDAVIKVAALKSRYRLARPEDRAGIGHEIVEAEKQVEEALAALKANSACFVFRSMSPTKFDKLITDNQLDDEAKAELLEKGITQSAIDQLPWDPDKFSVALVAAASYSPKISKKDALGLKDDDDWNTSEFNKLYETALAANTKHYDKNLARLGNVSSGTNGSSSN